MSTRVPSPGVKCGRGVTLPTHPHPVLRSRMSRSYISSPPCRQHAGSAAALLLLVKIRSMWQRCCYADRRSPVKVSPSPLRLLGLPGSCQATETVTTHNNNVAVRAIMYVSQIRVCLNLNVIVVQQDKKFSDFYGIQKCVVCTAVCHPTPP
jgi:hypothetical protein